MNIIFRRLIVVAASAAMLCLNALGASAQGVSQRPFRGLFGTSGSATPDQSLDLTLSLIEAYDDNLLAEASGSIDPQSAAAGGFYTMVIADGSYEWHGRQSQVGITGGTALRYYGGDDDVNASHTVGIGFSTTLPKRTTLFANQTVAYSPSYLYGLFPGVTDTQPGDALPVAPDYAVSDFSSVFYGSSLSVSRGLTRRGTISGAVDYQYTDFLDEGRSRRDLGAFETRVQFARGLSRHASLRVAYRYRAGEFGYGVGEDGKTTEHGFDIGVDYSKPLSPTRRFVMSFGFGPSVADVPAFDQVTAIGGRQYRAVGDFALGYQFRRTWETRATYRRGLEYVPELAAPVYTDGVTGVVNGLFTPRLDFAAQVGYSTGQSAVLRNTSTYDTYTASLRLRRAITRGWAAYLEYFYYNYDFGRAQLPIGVPPMMERNGVRVGLTVWMPVIRR